MQDIITGSVFLGLLVGLWNKIKGFSWKIMSTVLQRVEISTEESHTAIIGYLKENYKSFSNYDKVYGAQNETWRTGKYGLIPYEIFGEKSIIFIDSKKKYKFFNMPFLYSPVVKSKTTDNYGNYSSNEGPHSIIYFIKGTIDLDKIISNAVEKRNKKMWNLDNIEKSRFDIFYLPDKSNNDYHHYSSGSTGIPWYQEPHYRLIDVTNDDIGIARTVNGKALDNLYFPDDVKELINVISLWVKSREWYKQKGIPWKKGWLLYGPPGTGKTALVRAFAEDLNMPIYVFSLSQMSNSELISSWKSMQLNVPCMALIEDIDNVFDKRKNIAQNAFMASRLFDDTSNTNDSNNNTDKLTPLTFDCFINCIDGVDKSDGVFTIITTNDISKIDEAIGKPIKKDDGSYDFMSSRPGRIDRAIELSYMNKENKRQMAQKILAEYPDSLNIVNSHIEKDIQETPAQFQEFCAQIALKEYWKSLEL